MSYTPSGEGSLVADGVGGQYILAMPGGGLYVSSNADKAGDAGKVWFVKDGKKTLVDLGLKFATGLAYRPDQWLLSVADGHSKWVYSYQINRDGRLVNRERFFWLHVADWDDDAGAESVCYAREGQMLVATRWGIQVCADDGPTQVILPLPDRSRVMGVCLGGRDLDTLFAFGGGKIWARKVKVHALALSRLGHRPTEPACNSAYPGMGVPHVGQADHGYMVGLTYFYAGVIWFATGSGACYNDRILLPRSHFMENHSMPPTMISLTIRKLPTILLFTAALAPGPDCRPEAPTTSGSKASRRKRRL